MQNSLQGCRYVGSRPAPFRHVTLPVLSQKRTFDFEVWCGVPYMRSSQKRGFAKKQRWKCRSDGKRGRQDGEAVLPPPLPTALGNRQVRRFPHYAPHDGYGRYTDISIGRASLSFLKSSNMICT